MGYTNGDCPCLQIRQVNGEILNQPPAGYRARLRVESTVEEDRAQRPLGRIATEITEVDRGALRDSYDDGDLYKIGRGFLLE